MFSKQTDDAQPMRVTSPGDSFGRRLGRALITTAVLLAILLVTGVFVARSDGGRSFAEDRLAKWLGDEASIGRMHIGWPYVLVMEKVQTRRMADEGQPGCKALEVRISPRLFSPWHVGVTRGVLNLVEKPDGTWEPGAFTRLGELPDKGVADVSRIMEPLREKVSLTLTDASLRWIGPNGVPRASASGVSLSSRPADIPGHRMTHYRLSVYSSMGPGGKRAQDEEREWLASESKDYIELSRSSRQAQTGELGFWESSK